VDQCGLIFSTLDGARAEHDAFAGKVRNFPGEDSVVDHPDAGCRDIEEFFDLPACKGRDCDDEVRRGRGFAGLDGETIAKFFGAVVAGEDKEVMEGGDLELETAARQALVQAVE
jgi:hypothetical protein